jgi:biopolymer transport protein ExbB
MKIFSASLLPLAAFLAAGALTAHANFEQATRSADQDLANALRRYAALQEQIKTERIPLDRELNQLNAEIRDKRREAQRAQRLKDNSSVDLNALRNRVERRQEQIDYVANIVADLGQRFERDIDLSEKQLYAAEIERFQESLFKVQEDGELAKGLKLLEQFFIVDTAIRRFDSLIGGSLFPGEAVVTGGNLERGTFITVGPTVFFASGESPVAGLALKTGTKPPIFSISEAADRHIAALAVAGSGLVPLDPTLGSALALAAQRETLWEHILKGGIWIWPILFFAFLATATAIFKLFEIYSVKMPAPGALHEVLIAINAGDKAKALSLAEKLPGPSRAMMVDAVVHCEESKELIEEVMYERMLEVQPKMERMLPFIAVTAATAPLMGLLGTVTGMINTFKLITVFGTGDAKQLSSGISEALITTEFGLVVAIPSLIIHALLNRRSQAVMATMERMAVTFLNGLARKN